MLFHFESMKRIFCLVAVSLIVACSGESTYKKAEDAQDAGREFIRASLDGDIKKAKFYLLQDSANLYLMDKWKTDLYDKLSPAERRGYRESNIQPVRITSENDSIVSYVFTNSFKNDTMSIKILKMNGEWLVNLKDIH